MRNFSYILLLISLALFQGCVSDNPQFDRVLQSLPSFMIQMGTETLPKGGDSGDTDVCASMAIDPQDEGIYCAGSTRSDFAEANGDQITHSHDALILKFDRNQKLLWARQLGAVTLPGENSFSDRFTDLAFDSDGFIYASGNTDGRAMIAKFHRKGNLVWRKRISGSSSCESLQIWQDRIFCAGRDDVAQMAQVYEIDLNGNMLWLKQTSGGSENVSDMTVDHHGNLIVTGNTLSILESGHNPNFSKPDFFVWKVTQSGQEVWIEQFGSDDYSEESKAVAVDRNGAILIGGDFEGSGSSPPDSDFDPSSLNPAPSNGFVTSYRDTGAGLVENWQPDTLKSKSIGQSSVNSIAVTIQNEIILGGAVARSVHEAEEDSNFDALISKASSSGSLLMARQFGSVSRGRIDNKGQQICYGLAVDPLGNIVCGGLTDSPTNEPFGGGVDIMIWRVGPNLEF